MLQINCASETFSDKLTSTPTSHCKLALHGGGEKVWDFNISLILCFSGENLRFMCVKPSATRWLWGDYWRKACAVTPIWRIITSGLVLWRQVFEDNLWMWHSVTAIITFALQHGQKTLCTFFFLINLNISAALPIFFSAAASSFHPPPLSITPPLFTIFSPLPLPSPKWPPRVPLMPFSPFHLPGSFKSLFSRPFYSYPPSSYISPPPCFLSSQKTHG